MAQQQVTLTKDELESLLTTRARNNMLMAICNNYTCAACEVIIKIAVYIMTNYNRNILYFFIYNDTIRLTYLCNEINVGNMDNDAWDWYQCLTTTLKYSYVICNNTINNNKLINALTFLQLTIIIVVIGTPSGWHKLLLILLYHAIKFSFFKLDAFPQQLVTIWNRFIPTQGQTTSER